MSRTLIIAEPGSTHEGQLDRMRRLIDVAAECGADVFKNQWVSSPERLCQRRRAGEYLASYIKLAYPLGAHIVCREHAHARGLKYATSIYLPGDSALVAPFVDYLKISSFESADHALIDEAILAMAGRANQSHGLVLVSAGMSDASHASRVVCFEVSVLHCVSAYPAPLNSLNLGTIKEDYPHDYAGFSDHSHDVRVGAWAVCAGAEIIETHFRLDDTDPSNKDYAVSFTPAEFKTYVQNIRDAEAALGDGVKRIMPAEEPMLRYRVKP